MSVVAFITLMLAAMVAFVVVVVKNACTAKQAGCSSGVELIKCCRWSSFKQDRGLDSHVIGDECAGETRESFCHSQPNVGI